METLLQWAQFFSSLAIIGLAAFLIPLAFRLHRQVDAIGGAMRNLDRLVGRVENDAADFVRASVKAAERAERTIENARETTQAVRRWTEQADAVVEEVNAAIDPSLIALAREARAWGAGATAFVRVLAKPARKNGDRKEWNHERQ
jgi:hypothetical protein